MEIRPDISLVDGTALWMSRSGGDENPSELALLLVRAASGDAAAFEQIVVRHERRVLTLSWRLLGVMADAEDAAQEVFLRTFKYLHRFDPRKPFEPWLVRMTVNVCRDLGRKRRERGALLVEEGDAYERAGQRNPANNPDADLEAEQLRERLFQALRALPEKERAAFVLRDVEDMTTAEVAETLGTSEATVRSQISSARLKIRKLLGGRR